MAKDNQNLPQGTNSTPKKEVEILDPVDVCELLYISKRTLQTWRDKVKMPYHKIGNKIYFFKHELLEFIERFKVNGNGSNNNNDNNQTLKQVSILFLQCFWDV